MSYIFKGSLCGHICPDCTEKLAGVRVRLYRTEGDIAVARAVASEKVTVSVLDAAAIAEKEPRLLAETTTDDAGNFTFDLGEKQHYGGGPFELDILVERVPGQPEQAKGHEPVQLHVTTLQPAWRESGQNFAWAWQYCIPARIWCGIRGLFGVWTICGHVVTCDTKVPVPDVTVRAFDRDWLQDDALGSGVTDADGHYRIDYVPPQFQQTPFSPLFNVECQPGPDLYFKAEWSALSVLNESPSKGRTPGRENVGPCFCFDFCIDVHVEPPDPPWFTHVGHFHIYGDIDAGTGLTNKAKPLGPGAHGGPGYGFTGVLELRGYCPKKKQGTSSPMKYRFLYDNGGGQTPITAGMIHSVVVGSRQIQWDIFGTGLQWTFQEIEVSPSGATPAVTPPPSPLPPPGTPWGAPPTHVIVPDAQGWVEIDQTALDGGFYGPLLGFDSNVASPGGAPSPGVTAGHAVPGGSQRNGHDVALIFEATRVGLPGTDYTNSLAKARVNNWGEVELLDIAQFHNGSGTPCSPLSTDLDIEYTVDHELIAAWSVSMSTAATPTPSLTAPPSGTTPRGGFGTHHENMTVPVAWPSCSYSIHLTTRRALTDGINDDSAKTVTKTFCR